VKNKHFQLKKKTFNVGKHLDESYFSNSKFSLLQLLNHNTEENLVFSPAAYMQRHMLLWTYVQTYCRRGESLTWWSMRVSVITMMLCTHTIEERRTANKKIQARKKQVHKSSSSRKEGQWKQC